MATASTPLIATPLPVIANVSRITTRVVDRILGCRSDSPLMVASACVEALKMHGIESRVMYGPAAWIEVLENQSLIWAGCWGKSFHFWVATQFGEVVDLNASISHKKRADDQPDLKALYSPPILWSAEVPRFFRYLPEGVADLELTEQRDLHRWETVRQEIQAKCRPELLQGEAEEFPNEPMLVTGRRVLDDSHQTFRHFDRALGVRGIPQAPPSFEKT